MKALHSIKFVFTEEEIAHVRTVWEMLEDMDNYDYDELVEQIGEEFYAPSIGELFGCLDGLLHFMENHVDLQDN